jgi:hypothetical protein
MVGECIDFRFRVHADAGGGFLGFGGTRVTDAEKAALSAISSALKLTA